jgi:hypothetical protein
VDKRVTDDVDLNVKNLKPLGAISDSIFVRHIALKPPKSLNNILDKKKIDDNQTFI